MQQAGVQQLPHDDGNAPDVVEVDHVEPAVRLHVGDVRDATTDLVERLQLELDLRLVGDGEQMEHRVGRAAERHRHRDGVLERLTCEDLPRPDAQP